MNCDKNKTPILRHPRGNVLQLSFHLAQRRVKVVDGVNDTAEADFIHSGDVKVEFTSGKVSTTFLATMDGNKATVENVGMLPIGTYGIALLMKDSQGRPQKFKKRTILEVVEFTEEGGVYDTDEMDVEAYYPVISGHKSAIVIEGNKIYLEVGGRFGEDDDPDDGKAMISTGYGDGYIERENGKIILYI